MADIFTKEKRSEIMASISGRDTKPEKMVRSFLFRQGFRFRKNLKTLAGKPDIVLPKYKTIIFIHGCFWHGHNCKHAALPTSNVDFWKDKISGNINRDKRIKKELKKAGWKILIIWNCELKNKTKLEKTLGKTVKKLISNN